MKILKMMLVVLIVLAVTGLSIFVFSEDKTTYENEAAVLV